jgi:hypothetical protein
MDFQELITTLHAQPALDEQIDAYFATVGLAGHVPAEAALQALIGYFGEPHMQEASVYLDRGLLIGALPFPELYAIQNRFEMGDFFGREHLVIMAGQAGFLKTEGPKVQVAVYRPFEDVVDNSASIQLFEYDARKVT